MTFFSPDISLLGVTLGVREYISHHKKMVFILKMAVRGTGNHQFLYFGQTLSKMHARLIVYYRSSRQKTFS